MNRKRQLSKGIFKGLAIPHRYLIVDCSIGASIVYDCETYLMFPSFPWWDWWARPCSGEQASKLSYSHCTSLVTFLNTVSVVPFRLNLIYLRKKNVCDYQFDDYHFSLSNPLKRILNENALTYSSLCFSVFMLNSKFKNHKGRCQNSADL